MRTNDFLIAGSQRSGTNLARLILNSHPDCEVFAEQSAYDILSRRKPIPIGVQAKRYGYTIPIWTERLLTDERRYLLDESPTIVFLVRHPCAVLASMLKMGKKWFDTEVVRRVDEWSKMGKSPGSLGSPGWYGAKFWLMKTQSALQLRKQGQHVHVVSYERLVTKPARMIPGMLTALRLPWHDACLHHHERSHSDTKDGQTIGGTKADRPIDTESLDRWKESLTREQVATVRRVCREVYEHLTWLEL